MIKYDTQTPYVASYLVFRSKGKIALLLRSNTQWMNGHYGLPSGKVEVAESAVAAAIREAYEEVGVKITEKDLSFIHVMHRHHDETDWVDIYFEAERYEGELRNAEPEIHSELAWFELDNLPKNIVPYLPKAIESIEAGKTYSQYGW